MSNLLWAVILSLSDKIVQITAADELGDEEHGAMTGHTVDEFDHERVAYFLHYSVILI